MFDAELAWRGIRTSNPWWETRAVPSRWTRPFRRAAFGELFQALTTSSNGRGIVLLGPRRIGKTVLLHQIAEQLLLDGTDPRRVVHLALDDVALRGADLGAMLDLIASRLPLEDPDQSRFLLLDEVQHAREWSGWIKRLADRRDPYVFLATGSSATALRHGGQDAGLGRWREMVLYPWSFREHIHYRYRRDGLPALLTDLDETYEGFERTLAEMAQRGEDAAVSADLLTSLFFPRGAEGADERTLTRLNDDLIDYIVRGGFPEVLDEEDWREAQRHLRQDILDRALGRDIADVERVDSRALERMFLRVCKDPGGLWNGSAVASDLGLSRPTVARYLALLERAFLLFSFPNLASPVKGLAKVYLVAPSMRAALLGYDHDRVRDAVEWGVATENLVAATLLSTREAGAQVGFWREGSTECDAVALRAQGLSELLEVKTGKTQGAERGIEAAARALHTSGKGFVLSREPAWRKPGWTRDGRIVVDHLPVSLWLYAQRGAHGGTLSLRT